MFECPLVEHARREALLRPVFKKFKFPPETPAREMLYHVLREGQWPELMCVSKVLQRYTYAYRAAVEKVRVQISRPSQKPARTTSGLTDMYVCKHKRLWRTRPCKCEEVEGMSYTAS